MPVFIYRKIGPTVESKSRWSFAENSEGGKAVFAANGGYVFRDTGPSAYLISADNKEELIAYLLKNSKLAFSIEGTEPDVDPFDFDNTDDLSGTMDGVTIHFQRRHDFNPQSKETNTNAGRAAFGAIALSVAGGFGMPSTGAFAGASEALGDAGATALGRPKFSTNVPGKTGRYTVEFNIVGEGTNTGQKSISLGRLALVLAPSKVKRVRARK